MSVPNSQYDNSGISDLIPWLGLSISGDLAGLTIYTTAKGKIVWYPASPALKPPTPAQVKQRLRFKLALQLWQGLTPQQRKDWNTLCQKLALPYTGQNLWISLAMTPRPDQLSSANKAANLNLSSPPYLPP